MMQTDTAMGAAMKRAGHQTQAEALADTVRGALDWGDGNMEYAAQLLWKTIGEGMSPAARELFEPYRDRALKEALRREAEKMRAEGALTNAGDVGQIPSDTHKAGAHAPRRPDAGYGRTETAAAGTGHAIADARWKIAHPAANHRNTQPARPRPSAAVSPPRPPMAGLNLMAQCVFDTETINGIALGNLTVAQIMASAEHLRGRAKADNRKAKLLEMMTSGLSAGDKRPLREILSVEEAEKRAKLAEADDNA